MDVQLPLDLETKLTARARQQGRPAGDVVREAVTQYFADEERFIAAVRRGEAALDRGEVLTHEQVGTRLSRYLQP